MVALLLAQVYAIGDWMRKDRHKDCGLIVSFQLARGYKCENRSAGYGTAMTIDERLNRLEHYTAGLDEQARKDREESRQLWRETQREILTVSRKLNDLTEQFLLFQERAEERDRQTDERFRQTDERIQTLVSAIGEWMRKDRES